MFITLHMNTGDTKMDNVTYLNELINELMSDEEWDVPEDCKGILLWGISKSLLDL